MKPSVSQIFKKYLSLLVILPLLTSGLSSNYFDAGAVGTDAVVIPKSITESQIAGKYVIAFEVCTAEEPVMLDDVIAASDMEEMSLAKSTVGEIPPNTCYRLETQIHADDLNSIRILVLGTSFKFSLELDERSSSSMTATPRSAGSSEFEATGLAVDLSHLERQLTEAELKECETVYDDYITLGESTFSVRYVYHKFMGDCVLLYNDSVWENDEDDRYEKLNQMLPELREQKEEIRKEKIRKAQISMSAITSMAMGELQTERTSFIELQTPGTYLFLFEGCAVKEVNLDDMVIASDKEVVLVFPPGVLGGTLTAGNCREFEVKILADDPNTIRSIPLGVMSITKMSPRAQMANGIPASEVTCNEGLDLILKSRDGSAACVKPSTALKLIDRGWGTLV
ncbi:MAG: hypothetical exported protein [Marine Group I thaumarchaeote]|nr:MAG: hypothetical exported protein [Marine Group I thaumarchaeote]